MNQSIEVPASRAGVLHLIAFADEVEQRDQLSFEQSYMLRLVIEEIGTNIVKYGYPQAAPGAIQLQCAYDNGLLRVIIRDHGCPFDPRAHPDPDVSADIAMFITVFYGVLEPFTGELSYVNAGHNPPLVFPGGAGLARELESSALPLGIVSGQVYAIAHTTLAPGEQLVSFSDGITEAMNVAGEPYGDKRLHAALHAHSGTPAPALVKRSRGWWTNTPPTRPRPTI